MDEKEVESVYLAYLILDNYEPQNQVDKRILRQLKAIINKYSSEVFFT